MIWRDSARQAPTTRRSLASRQALGGQSLVEFALILPAVIVVAFGIVQLIFLLRTDGAVSDLAHQDVQEVALLGQCDGTCLQDLIGRLGLSPGAVQIDVTALGADGTAHALPAAYGDDVVVQVTYTYGFDVPLLGHQQRALGATATQVSTAAQG